MTLHSDLLAILACTECKGRLVYFADREFLFCPSCRLRYAVADEIPTKHYTFGGNVLQFGAQATLGW